MDDDIFGRNAWPIRKIMLPKTEKYVPEKEKFVPKDFGFKHTAEYCKKVFNQTDPHMNPVYRAKSVIKRYHKDPTFTKYGPGGKLVWFYSDERMESIKIFDEYHIHKKPADHFDFMYSVFKVREPYTFDDKESMFHEKLQRDNIELTSLDIKNITHSSNLDAVSNMLEVRCHFEGANDTTAFITYLYLFDIISYKEAIKYYGELIMKIIKEEKNYGENKSPTHLWIIVSLETYKFQGPEKWLDELERKLWKKLKIRGSFDDET